MKNIIFLTIILLTITSCGKKNFTSVQGQVFEKGSNKPVANAQVIFSRCVPGDGTGAAAICTDIETVTTDANGRYVFTKESDKADSYRIRAEKTNYGKPVEVFQTANAGESTKDINFTLPAFAWIKFHVKNVNPFDDNDLIRAPGSIGVGNYNFYGKNIDTTYLRGPYLGNFKTEENWFIFKKNTSISKKDSIFCKPLDTVFYEIKY
jgi:hypothetical protein